MALPHSFRQVTETVVRNVRTEARPTISWAIRLTATSVAAYLMAKIIYPDADPLLAPLTAILVTQVTVSSIVRHGFDRVLSVVVGVMVATAFTAWAGLTWWSLGLIVAAAVVAGQLFRVGPNFVEVPISAMVVMSVGAETAGWPRVIETLIGAAVGVLINFVFSPGVRAQNAGVTIEQFGIQVADLLEKTASELTESASPDDASRWLQSARDLSTNAAKPDAALSHADESRRLNVRALGTYDTGPALRAGFYSLERCAVSVRSIFRGINDVVHFPAEVVDDKDPEAFPVYSRQQTSIILNHMSSTIRAFSRLVHAQVHGTGEAEQAELQSALDELDVERKLALDALRANVTSDQHIYELNVFVLATAGRVQRELDPRGHKWIEERRRWESMESHRALLAAQRLSATTRQFTERTKRPLIRDGSRRV